MSNSESRIGEAKQSIQTQNRRPCAVLFVCLGNICRSPAAEGVLRALIAKATKPTDWEIDSAATGTWHTGEGPDARSIKACQKHGIDISGHHARRVGPEDFECFDWILACDEQNYRDLEVLAPAQSRARLRLLMSFAPELGMISLPDPYYENAAAFDAMVVSAKAACEGFLRTTTDSDCCK